MPDPIALNNDKKIIKKKLKPPKDKLSEKYPALAKIALLQKQAVGGTGQDWYAHQEPTAAPTGKDIARAAGVVSGTGRALFRGLGSAFGKTLGTGGAWLYGHTMPRSWGGDPNLGKYMWEATKQTFDRPMKKDVHQITSNVLDQDSQQLAQEGLRLQAQRRKATGNSNWTFGDYITGMAAHVNNPNASEQEYQRILKDNGPAAAATFRQNQGIADNLGDLYGPMRVLGHIPGAAKLLGNKYAIGAASLYESGEFAQKFLPDKDSYGQFKLPVSVSGLLNDAGIDSEAIKHTWSVANNGANAPFGVYVSKAIGEPEWIPQKFFDENYMSRDEYLAKIFQVGHEHGPEAATINVLQTMAKANGQQPGTPEQYAEVTLPAIKKQHLAQEAAAARPPAEAEAEPGMLDKIQTSLGNYGQGAARALGYGEQYKKLSPMMQAAIPALLAAGGLGAGGYGLYKLFGGGSGEEEEEKTAAANIPPHLLEKYPWLASSSSVEEALSDEEPAREEEAEATTGSADIPQHLVEKYPWLAGSGSEEDAEDNELSWKEILALVGGVGAVGLGGYGLYRWLKKRRFDRAEDFPQDHRELENMMARGATFKGTPAQMKELAGGKDYVVTAKAQAEAARAANPDYKDYQHLDALDRLTTIGPGGGGGGSVMMRPRPWPSSDHINYQYAPYAGDPSGGFYGGPYIGPDFQAGMLGHEAGHITQSPATVADMTAKDQELYDSLIGYNQGQRDYISNSMEQEAAAMALKQWTHSRTGDVPRTDAAWDEAMDRYMLQGPEVNYPGTFFHQLKDEGGLLSPESKKIMRQRIREKGPRVVQNNKQNLFLAGLDFLAGKTASYPALTKMAEPADAASARASLDHDPSDGYYWNKPVHRDISSPYYLADPYQPHPVSQSSPYNLKSMASNVANYALQRPMSQGLLNVASRGYNQLPANWRDTFGDAFAPEKGGYNEMQNRAFADLSHVQPEVINSQDYFRNQTTTNRESSPNSTPTVTRTRNRNNTSRIENHVPGVTGTPLAQLRNSLVSQDRLPSRTFPQGTKAYQKTVLETNSKSDGKTRTRTRNRTSDITPLPAGKDYSDVAPSLKASNQPQPKPNSAAAIKPPEAPKMASAYPALTKSAIAIAGLPIDVKPEDFKGITRAEVDRIKNNLPHPLTQALQAGLASAAVSGTGQSILDGRVTPRAGKWALMSFGGGGLLGGIGQYLDNRRIRNALDDAVQKDIRDKQHV